MSAAVRGGDPAALRLHPLVHVLEDRRPGREGLCGLFHILTGDCLRIGSALLAQALDGADTAEAEATREALAEWDFLADAAHVSRDAHARLLSAWRDRRLSIPAHVPTLASVRDDAVRLYRPEGLEVCRLPRDARVPAVIREDLDPRCGPLLDAAERNAPLGETLDRLRLAPDEAMRLLTQLAHPGRQAIRLVASAAAEADLRAQHHYPMQSFEPTREIGPAAAHYESGIEDAQFDFDWLEPTVAHAFRRPTAALDGRNYGATLFAKLCAHAANADRFRLLEVGAGTGELALGFLQAARRAGVPIEYHILDRSPALLAAQAERLRAHDLPVVQHRGDAQRALPDLGGFDIILLNEVISDFDVCDGVQYGAHALLRLLPQALSPGGRAVLIEYGGLNAVPERVEHLAHEEYSIGFADLRDVARGLGLQAEVHSLGDWLGARWDTPMLVGQQERLLCLRAAFADHGVEFEWRAYDRDDFLARHGALCERLGLKRLTFAPLRAGHQFGPDLRQFLALEATRRTGADARGDAP